LQSNETYDITGNDERIK